MPPSGKRKDMVKRNAEVDDWAIREADRGAKGLFVTALGTAGSIQKRVNRKEKDGSVKIKRPNVCLLSPGKINFAELGVFSALKT